MSATRKTKGISGARGKAASTLARASVEIELSLRLAGDTGLLQGPLRHINAKVPAALLRRAAERAGTAAITAVITQALAGLATRDELGPFLARQAGALAELSPEAALLFDEL